MDRAMYMWSRHWSKWTREDRAIAARFPDSLIPSTLADARDAVDMLNRTQLTSDLDEAERLLEMLL